MLFRSTKNLELGIEKYSARLERSLESKILGLSDRTIELDPYDPSYKRIDTATGMFFISVREVEPVQGGYRLSLQIGNPNYADFRDFTLRLVWGSRWNPNSKLTYEQWRDSLTGAQYSFKGKLERGKWNPIDIEMVPATKADLAYIECELGVSSLELELR